MMAGAFTPARPVGCRAWGGMLVAFKLLDECAAEVTALARNELDPKLTPAAVKVLAASLRELILQLRTGALAFDGSRPGGRVIERHDCLYELRPRHSNGVLAVRDLRMYCGEPAIVQQLSLGLHLATKPHGVRDTAREQDSSIDEAVRRAGVWEMNSRRAILRDGGKEGACDG